MPDPVKPDDRGALENTDQNADEVFDTAFDQAAEAGDRAELSSADDPKNVPAGDSPPPVIEDRKEQDKAEPEPEPAPESPPAPAPDETDEKSEQRYKTLQGILKKEKETWEAEKAALLAQVEEAKKAVPPPPAPAPEKKETAIPKDLEGTLTEEEKVSLKEYDEEFDVVSKMEGKKRELALRELRKEFKTFVDTLKDELTAQLAPATALVAETKVEREKREEETHFSTIRENHADFEKYRDDGSVVKWIESKPRYMQKSMVETYNQGSAEDVVELFNDFKKDNNIPLTPQPAPDTNVVQMSPKKAEKKLAMTAVTTRRGAVNTSMAVASDFEGAWDEATHKQGG